MALPVRPNSAGAPKQPAGAQAASEVMPELPAMALPELPEVQIPTYREPQVAPPQHTKQAQSPVGQNSPNDGWEIDKETGKHFKLLPGYKQGVMKHSAAIIKAGGMTLTQLRSAVDEDPDFSLDDLNGSAETFLSHLRVPPDKEEQARLIAERAMRQKNFDEAASRVVEENDFED